MSHTQVQVCKKLDNSVGEKNQLISKSLPRTVKQNILEIVLKVVWPFKAVFSWIIASVSFQIMQMHRWFDVIHV
jgi:hypothetical protein